MDFTIVGQQELLSSLTNKHFATHNIEAVQSNIHIEDAQN